MDDDAQLNRMAIEEIVREMHQEREQREKPRIERKLNPLGKPNKRFLGRTINSMLTHNKREDHRTKERCRRKLVELDKRKKQTVRRNSRSRSSSSSDSTPELRPRKHTKNKKKSKYRRRSSNSEDRKPEYNEEFFEGEGREDFFMQLQNATAVYNQMNLLQYQAILAGAGVAEINEKVQNDDCCKKSPKSKMRKRRKTNSNPSRSSSDESGGLVTINLSSDDSKFKSSQKHKFRRKNSGSSSSIEFYMDSDSSSSSAGSSEEDKVTLEANCISLDSNESFSSNGGNIVILSDSETDLKVNEGANQVTAPSAPVTKIPETSIEIDLTED